MIKWYEHAGEKEDVIMSTRIRLARNLPELPFPCRMKAAQRRQAEQLVGTAAQSENALSYRFEYIRMEEAQKALAVSLVERRLASPDLISNRDGRGLLLTPDEALSVMVNEEDHLRLQGMHTGLSLEETFLEVNELDRTLNRDLHFAFDEALGYLTQNPGDLGTGMHASLMLHLPALRRAGSIARVGAVVSSLGMSLSGGRNSQQGADVYQLSNRVTLGLSEQNALSNLKSIGMQLLLQERESRRELAQTLEAQDLVARSLGILRCARLLTYDEFLKRISPVRLGISAGLVENIGYETVSRLLVRCQPATMMLESGKSISQLDGLRAEIVREGLS